MKLLLRALLCTTFTLLCLGTSQAKMSNWTDTQGTSFKAEPSGCFGPFALFKTSNGGGRRVLFRMLSPDECRRFYQELPSKPSNTASWAQSKASLSSALVGRVLQLKEDKLHPTDLSKVPEPELYILYFGSAWGGESYETSELFKAAYNRLKRVYGAKLETIFFGLRHDDQGNANLARATHAPWLIANYREQNSIGGFTRFAPAEGQLMVAVTREGFALAQSEVKNVQGLKQFIDDVAGLLTAADPENPLFLTDRAALLRQARPLMNPSGQLAPLILNTPFAAASLRKAKIARISAELKIASDGKVLSATLDENPPLSPALRSSLEKGLLTGCLVLPALNQGSPVEGTCRFDSTVPAADESLDNDRTWLQLSNHREISITSWLLLRPIPVPASAFSNVQGVNEKGVTTMSAFKVAASDTESVSHKSQMNAFNSDFFAEAGASAVRPIEGLSQTVDEEPYTWEKVNASDGFVDFSSAKNRDYCVGYAYTDFESPTAGPALMAIGSDDGVKIWLNGTLVKDRWVRRTSKIDEDLIPLTLIAGKNRLLIKIQNASGAWSFFTRIRR